jgi:hypothetical protein
MKIAMVMAADDSAAMGGWLAANDLAAEDLQRWTPDDEVEVAGSFWMRWSISGDRRRSTWCYSRRERWPMSWPRGWPGACEEAAYARCYR